MLSSHVLCRTIFIWIVAGENHPKASKTLDTSESSTLLLMASVSMNSEVARLNESDLVSHSTPSVFATPVPESDIDKTSSASLSSDGMESRTHASFEFHFLSCTVKTTLLY